MNNSVQVLQNDFGHAVFTVVGMSLSARDEMNRLGNEWISAGLAAALCGDDYESHRLEDGLKYKVVVVPGSDILLPRGNRTMPELREYARRAFGYEPLPAGGMFRLREIAFPWMVEKDIFYISGTDRLIKDDYGTPHTLLVYRYISSAQAGVEAPINYERVRSPADQIDTKYALAFLDP